MKRDMDLICDLLTYVEKNATDEPLPVPKLDGYSKAQIHYHIGLCSEAGYLRASFYRDDITKRCKQLGHLTWAGHELLDERCPDR